VKQCTKCGETKPLDEFRLDKRHGPTKRQAACRGCQAEYSRKYSEKNKEKIAERGRKWHEANREKQNAQSRERYWANPEMEAARRRKYYEANKEKIAVRHKAYSEANKEKIAERYRKWAAANPEKVREYQRRYREKYPERALESTRRYVAANPEKVRETGRKYSANNREKRAEYARQWKESGRWQEWWDEYYRENSDKYFESSARRRAKLAEAESDGHTTPELHEYWRARGIDPEVCTYCDGPIPNWKTSVGDHVLPMHKGGPDVVENLAPCCQPCNASKRDKVLFDEWTPPNMREEAA
jgi:hypothetical protein